MSSIIRATGLSKKYGKFNALENIEINIEPGKIVGLIGPNGAGKTTVLRCLLGLSQYDGQLDVLGRNPKNDRVDLLKDVAFIADTAVLPSWIRVSQLLEYMNATHPNFDIRKAKSFLAQTDISSKSKVKELSKGMVTQLHLALVISIDAKLLVLDEPTLGLDIIYRKRFYEQLLNDYFDESRTILITTHQVEEIEPLLTDLMFIKKGSIVLDMSMEDMAETYIEIEVHGDKIAEARTYRPVSERSVLGGVSMIFENPYAEAVTSLGKARVPSVADLFVAKME